MSRELRLLRAWNAKSGGHLVENLIVPHRDELNAEHGYSYRSDRSLGFEEVRRRWNERPTRSPTPLCYTDGLTPI
ncbi:MAG: hypothetical protein GY854_01470 [Deltaproteobacteria bacterium]|nr:hypothetical protein [Deltaproteobacteria bacterium]